MIGLGHLLGMLVVAEGVENEVQVEFLCGPQKSMARCTKQPGEVISP